MSIRVGVFVRRLPHVRSADTYVCSADMFMLATLTGEQSCVNAIKKCEHQLYSWQQILTPASSMLCPHPLSKFHRILGQLALVVDRQESDATTSKARSFAGGTQRCWRESAIARFGHRTPPSGWSTINQGRGPIFVL